MLEMRLEVFEVTGQNVPILNFWILAFLIREKINLSFVLV
jgi:hypothetical protein